MASGSAAEMIKRFREGKPTSRKERSQLSNKREMWWIANEGEDFVNSGAVDDIEEPRIMSPLKPTTRPQQPQYDTYYNSRKRVEQFTRDSRVDDLIADDIEELGGQKRGTPDHSFRSSLDKYVGEDIRDRYADKILGMYPTRVSREVTARTLSHTRPEYSIDTVGSIGRNGLLAPHLKLDGKVDSPASKELRSFEEIMHSLNDGRREGPETLAGVQAELQSHMQSFTAAFNEKYAKEEADAAERVARDARMREEGRMEERARAIADYQYFSTIISENTADATHDIAPIDASPTEETPELVDRSVHYRHGLYERSALAQGVGSCRRHPHIHPAAEATWQHGPYREELDDSLLYTGRTRIRRLDALYALHMLDPPAAWIRRPGCSPHPSMRTAGGGKERALEVADKREADEVIRQVDEKILSAADIHHATISHAVESIENTLNVALASLHIRLPPPKLESPQETNVPVETVTSSPASDSAIETKGQTEHKAAIARTHVEPTDAIVEPSVQAPVGRSVSACDLDLLDKILGENGINLAELPSELPSTNQHFCPAETAHQPYVQQTRSVKFHTLQDVEKELRRGRPHIGGSPAQEGSMKSTLSFHSHARLPHSEFNQKSNMEPSAPRFSGPVMRMPRTLERAPDSAKSWNWREAKDYDHTPLEDNFINREKFLQDMKRCRQDFQYSVF